MRILFLSDTHTFHRQYKLPADLDMIIHTGDVSNVWDPHTNANEVLDFIEWYESLPVKHKLWCAGNHDGSIEKGLVKPKKIQQTTTYLEHEWIEIEGLKIFLSPFTPIFGTWYFMRKREKMFQYWEHIPEDCDIVGTHGPCKGILDISENRERTIEYCGDSALLKRIQKVNPKIFCGGHIHDFQGHMNYGTRTIDGCRTTFINAAMVHDGKFDWGLCHPGHVIEIDKQNGQDRQLEAGANSPDGEIR